MRCGTVPQVKEEQPLCLACMCACAVEFPDVEVVCQAMLPALEQQARWLERQPLLRDAGGWRPAALRRHWCTGSCGGC